MDEWRIYVGNTLYSKTDWLPVAVGAWERATRDKMPGEDVVMLKNGHEIARVTPRREGHPWPDTSTVAPTLNDVAAAITQLTRASGINITTLAESMSQVGIPTARSRLDRIRSVSREADAHTSPAELIVLCYAAISILRQTTHQNDS